MWRRYPIECKAKMKILNSRYYLFCIKSMSKWLGQMLPVVKAVKTATANLQLLYSIISKTAFDSVIQTILSSICIETFHFHNSLSRLIKTD